MRALLRGFALACTAILLMGAAVGAQTVVGEVVTEGTLEPLAGAFVVLEGEAGERHGAGLAGDEGRFVLRAPGPGTYRLVARMIGYADAVTEPRVLEAGETVRWRVEVAVRAISLEGIRAEVGKRCHGRPDRELRTARLWEEARKALEIADWARGAGTLRFHMVERRSELDAATLRVTSTRETGRGGYYDQSPYRSAPAEALRTRGYVQADGDGNWDHFAPDAEVLLSDAFLDTHCFRVLTGEDPDLVGLGFEPIQGRALPDIDGVLWLDRATAELRRLDFRYVQLPYPHGDWHQVGGMVEFERLSTGTWIVRRWRIRMPLAATRTTTSGVGPERLTLTALVEEGAEVARVRTRAGHVLSESMGATLYGIVADGGTGESMEGATVEVPPTGARATTGPDGAYRLTSLPTGEFGVVVTHPDLELLAGRPLSLPATLEAGQATRLPIRLDLRPLALDLCAGAGRFGDPVVLRGTIRDPVDGGPVPGALVRAFTAGPPTERQAVSDSAGEYLMCVERSDSTEVAAVAPADVRRPRASLTVVRVGIGGGVVARADVELSRPALAVEWPPRGGGAAIVGTVRLADDLPVAGAMVVIRQAGGRPVYSAVTTGDGRFRLPNPSAPLQRYALSVEHAAFGTVRGELELGSGEQIEVAVTLADRPIPLAPITVTARRRSLLVEVGFYDRMERGRGVYVDRAEIERRSPSRITDLLHGRRGFRIVQTEQSKYDIRTGSQARRQGDCQPSIWVDGSRVREAGTPASTALADPSTTLGQLQLSEIVSPDEVEGIEVYTGSAGLPQRFGGSQSACGVVVIWTRR